MYPVLFEFGSLRLYSWGFMLAVAVLIAIWGIGRLFEREGYDRDSVFEMIILMVICGLIGSHLAYILVYQWEEFLADPLIFFNIKNGIEGMIWYGAFIGGLIPFIIYIYRMGLSFWKMADIFSPYLALGYALVRIGCFLRGCCYGEITTSPWGVVFPVVDEFARHPTQLYSSALNFLLFLFLIWFYPRRRFHGQVFLFYLIGYSIYRFIVEFFRETVIFYGFLSMGQVYTLGLLVIAILLYFWQRSRSARYWF
ncbi:MAG TPA: prolipoprotein diacylglyceryl transferase [Syntrophomonadaceae bacterium]|nr:prolipoprotein diacylglyceryl transferase [Syntrophomonadaceae bacterium]HOQ09195.1 prolipoprotein diacylglyceryl transferase [Syntrophomonadaceae bacterium]HPU48558.1 prolipoprotein diacylglyceryl transferase [Syntrophomonadaceae bacterium]